MYLLLYNEEDGSKRLHDGGRVWKGDTQRPVPLNMQKLSEAQRLDRFVRFRQFQSTTKDKGLAEKYRAREDGKGYLWIIDIPQGFWGARDIQGISWKENESETLFPPYSAFRVQSLDENSCNLLAVVLYLHSVRMSTIKHIMLYWCPVVKTGLIPLSACLLVSHMKLVSKQLDMKVLRIAVQSSSAGRKDMAFVGQQWSCSTTKHPLPLWPELAGKAWAKGIRFRGLL